MYVKLAKVGQTCRFHMGTADDLMCILASWLSQGCSPKKKKKPRLNPKLCEQLYHCRRMELGAQWLAPCMQPRIWPQEWGLCAGKECGQRAILGYRAFWTLYHFTAGLPHSLFIVSGILWGHLGLIPCVPNAQYNQSYLINAVYPSYMQAHHPQCTCYTPISCPRTLGLS